jgi:sugar/nucleoside kinase (ribokinase family)
MKELDIVVVGELNADLILTGLPSLPEIGQCKLSKDMCFTLGSASAIFASNISRLGLKVGFIGKVGNDDLGDFVLKSLGQNNVDTSHIIRDESAKTGICVSLSFPENYAMASYAGVRETLTLSDINLDFVAKAGHLHMSSYYLQPGLQEGCAELFKTAKDMGLTTSLDPDSDPTGRWDETILGLLKYIDIFLPNEKEAQLIAKCDTVESALDLLSRTVKIVVIKTGEKGVWVKKSGRTIHADAFTVNAVDTTGAGDSFNSGFIYQFYKGSSIEDCILWGNACGAISTTEPGGTTAFPNLSQVEQFLKSNSEQIKQLLHKINDSN